MRIWRRAFDEESETKRSFDEKIGELNDVEDRLYLMKDSESDECEVNERHGWKTVEREQASVSVFNDCCPEQGGWSCTEASFSASRSRRRSIDLCGHPIT